MEECGAGSGLCPSHRGERAHGLGLMWGPGASSSRWPWSALGIVPEQGGATFIAVPTLARVLDSCNGGECDSLCPGERACVAALWL